MEERAYEVRVAGLVHTEDLLDELSDVEVAEHEFRTVLTGHFADQAALHGFLHRLRAFGLEVVEVRRVSTSDEGRSAAPGELGPGVPRATTSRVQPPAADTTIEEAGTTP
jgi:hypothetical protein